MLNYIGSHWELRESAIPESKVFKRPRNLISEAENCKVFRLLEEA